MIDLPPFNGLMIGLILMVVALVIAVVYFQRGRNQYDVLDILMDHGTNRASLDAHIVVFFSALAAWYVVSRTLDHDPDVGSTLVQIIMIMVIYRGARQAINLFNPSSGGARLPQLPEIGAPRHRDDESTKPTKPSEPLPSVVQSRKQP